MQVAMLGPLEVRDGADWPLRGADWPLRGADWPLRGAGGTSRGGDAVRAAALLGAAEGVRGTRDRSDEDSGRVTAAVRALLAPADYEAAFQRGLEVTVATPGEAPGWFLDGMR